MVYYAVQVKTRCEEDYVLRLRASPIFAPVSIFIPKRAVYVRKKGKHQEETALVFPGYVFLGISETLLPELYWHIRRTPGFYRFLPSNQAALPLTGHDVDLLTHFISFGKCADTSKVNFDENDRIVVLEGPLKGLEGLIVKVDRRKRRAKVRLDMCQNSFLIDLAFTVVERSEKGQTKANGESRRA